MRLTIINLEKNTLGEAAFHLLLASAILFVLCILYFSVFLPNITNHNQTITVPDVEGKHVNQLEHLSVKSHLLYEVKDSSYSSEVPPLTVLKQYPQAGAKVKEGRKVFISINQRNPPTVPMPELVDGSVINAEAVLRSSQLNLGQVEIVPGPYKVVKEMKLNGKVIEASKLVPKGAVIDLVVMDGLTDDPEVSIR